MNIVTMEEMTCIDCRNIFWINGTESGCVLCPKCRQRLEKKYMAKSNEKWIMFKNFLHNELGITKEDIREWIKEAVHEEAERMVENTYDEFSTRKIIRSMLFDKETFFGRDTLQKEVRAEVASQLLKRLKIDIKLKEDE